MRVLFPFLVFVCSFLSCAKTGTVGPDSALAEEINPDDELPYTTLAELSPGFRFTIRSMVVVGSETRETFRNLPYMAVINDQETYLQRIATQQLHPAIDFSTHTLLAVGLNTRGSVKITPVKEGEKTILKVHNEIPEIGPQGSGPYFLSAVVPKTDSVNVSMELKVVNVQQEKKELNEPI